MTEASSNLTPSVSNIGLLPRANLTEMIVSKLIEAILDQTFPPGSRLVETALAERLGVSRNPLREALSKMQSLGLVETKPGRGSFVAEFSIDDFEKMVPVRASLEGLAAGILAREGTDVALSGIASANAHIRACAAQGDVSGCRDAGWKFHRALVQLSENRFLFDSWEPLSLRVRLFMHASDVYLKDLEKVVSVHDKMVSLIENGEAEDAEDFVRSSILRHGFEMIGRKMPASKYN